LFAKRKRDSARRDRRVLLGMKVSGARGVFLHTLADAPNGA
jgi:hypothetical protein